jgi:hypothetical protein
MMKAALKAVLVISSLALPDSAVIYEFPDGRSVGLTSSGEITMEAESVSIVPSGTGCECWTILGDQLPMMEVKCVFYLVNRSESPQEVTVGFPIDTRFGDAYTVFSDSMLVAIHDSLRSDPGDREWFDTGFMEGNEAADRVPAELDFTAVADGDSLDVFYRTCRFSLEERMIRDPVVAVWRMDFQPHQTIRLVNRYMTSWDYLGGGPWGDYSVRYVLTTGSTWQGPIGDAVITLTVPEELPLPQLSDTLEACWDWSGSPEVSGRTVEWRFSDFEPSEDLRFSVMTVLTDPIYEDIYAGELLEGVTWQRGRILGSAASALHGMMSWSQNYNAELVLRLLEASLEISQGREAPYPALMHILCGYDPGSTVISAEKADSMASALAQEREDLEEDVRLAGESGYLQFLPLFTVKFRWERDDIDRYASRPDLEEPFLRVLSGAETARAGGTFDDPALGAFYRLTGWYIQGDSSWYVPSLSEAVEEYRQDR